MQDRERHIMFAGMADDNGNATPLQMRKGLPFGFIVPHRIGISHEETAAFFGNGRQRDRDDGQRRGLAQLQTNPQDTDKREQHRETAETKQGDEHAERDDTVPEHVEAQRNRCEFRVLRGDDQPGFIIAGMEIDEHDLDILLVAHARLFIGKIRLAGREDRLARLAAAVDIAVFNLQRVFADLIVAQYARAFGHEHDDRDHQKHGNGEIIGRRHRNDATFEAQRPRRKFYLCKVHGRQRILREVGERSSRLSPDGRNSHRTV
ncbi:hypothetical protein D3C86_1278170 [compost metagenome]